MIINYGLNKDGTFNFWQISPIEAHLPTLEVADPMVIKLNKTKLINGVIVQPEEKTDTEKLKSNFRNYRRVVFLALDVFEKNVLMGRETANKAVSEVWYAEMLAFADEITVNTSPQDFPKVPACIKKYI